MNWRWHVETLRIWRRRFVCLVAGHRDEASVPHAAHCYRPQHEDYPDLYFCRYCEEWIE